MHPCHTVDLARSRRLRHACSSVSRARHVNSPCDATIPACHRYGSSHSMSCPHSERGRWPHRPLALLRPHAAHAHTRSGMQVSRGRGRNWAPRAGDDLTIMAGEAMPGVIAKRSQSGCAVRSRDRPAGVGWRARVACEADDHASSSRAHFVWWPVSSGPAEDAARTYHVQIRCARRSRVGGCQQHQAYRAFDEPSHGRRAQWQQAKPRRRTGARVVLELLHDHFIV